MDPASLNLPIVLQQAGDVSRVADLAQRQALVQQAAAAQEGALQQELERSSVPRPQRTDAENRVRAGDREGGGGQAPPQDQRRQRQPEAQQTSPPAEGSLVVDVLV